MIFSDGFETNIRTISQTIVENDWDPPYVRLRKILSKSIREIAMSGLGDDFKQGRKLRRVAKIPISKTFEELAAMDFLTLGIMGIASMYMILSQCIRLLYLYVIRKCGIRRKSGECGPGGADSSL